MPVTDLVWTLDPGTLGGPNVGGADAEQTGLDVYGRDILFTNDLQVGNDGDFVTVDGSDNLRRSILRRLLCRQGEYKLNPQYGAGVPAYVKKLQTKANLDELRHAIVDQLSRERRIDKVIEVDVEATFYGDQPAIVVTIVAQAIGRNLSFQPFTFTSTGVV